MTEIAHNRESSFHRYLTITVLIMAGEAVFFLPYVITRVFRPTFLEVFDLTNLELGFAFSFYGVVAMLSYALGGPVADRFSARALMTIALVATAAGGLYMASVPSLRQLTLLYGFWGLTSILLFWAALIRATREWGGESRLGVAFGLLDGGRGLFVALIGAASVFLFAAVMPANVESATLDQRSEALRQVILLFTGATFVVGALVWLALPPGTSSDVEANRRFSLRGIPKILAMPAVWLQAVIIICAYVGYKALDDVSLYAREVLEFDEVRAAGVGAAVLWVRPVACVVAGVLADRTSTTGMTLLCFALMFLGSAALASGVLAVASVALFFFAAATSAAGIYALRGLYFAIMGEAKIPLTYTGTAVGLVSTLGYTPDIFTGPLMGYLLDTSPGPPGHYHWFMVVGGFALTGLIATLIFRRVTAD